MKLKKTFFLLNGDQTGFYFFSVCFGILSKWLPGHQDPESLLLLESRKSISRDSICQFQSILQSFVFILRLPGICSIDHVPPLLKCRPTDIINKRPTNTFSLMASQFAATVCGFKTVAGIPSLPILNVGISWCLLCCDTHVC